MTFRPNTITGDGLQRTKEAGLLKRKLLGAVSAKSPPASWNTAIERHSATETGANGALIVRGERRRCVRAVDWSTLTLPGWPKRKSQVNGVGVGTSNSERSKLKAGTDARVEVKAAAYLDALPDPKFDGLRYNQKP
jgi:hypothetical protein